MFRKWMAVTIIAFFVQELRAADLAVVSVSPNRHVLTAPVNSSIVVEFDKAVNPATITPTTFWAFGRWSGAVTGTYSFANGNQTVILNPDFPFSAGETVMVILSHDITAADATTLRSSGYSWQFWTKAQPAPMAFAQIASMTTRTTPGQTTQSYGGIGTDLNHDRYLDLTIVNEDTADLRVFMNKADNTGEFDPFDVPTYPVGATASPSEPSDFDRDGHSDICVANIGAHTVSILLGNGDGTYGPAQNIGVGLNPRGIAVLDVDGDGDVDVVNTSFGSNTMALLLNNGAGVFGAPSFFDAGGTGERALAVADMNDDGLLDLVVGLQTAQQIRVNLSNGDGTFTALAAQSAGGQVWMLNAADIDGDGDEDVVVVNGNSNNGGILRNNGDGTLAPPVTTPTDPFSLGSDLGDLDGDGDLDWITSSFSGDWQIRTNNGTGTFAFLMEINSPVAASCSIPMDIDNDGDLDLALIDEIADVVIIMRNSGYTAPIPAVGTWGVTILALGVAAAGSIAVRRKV